MEELRNEVIKALDKIRPYLQNDGGDITLVDIEDGKIVKVRLEGTCTSCSVNQLTLRSGVEMTIKEYVPQIEKVISTVVRAISTKAKREPNTKILRRLKRKEVFSS